MTSTCSWSDLYGQSTGGFFSANKPPLSGSKLGIDLTVADYEIREMRKGFNGEADAEGTERLVCLYFEPSDANPDNLALPVRKMNARVLQDAYGNDLGNLVGRQIRVRSEPMNQGSGCKMTVVPMR